MSFVTICRRVDFKQSDASCSKYLNKVILRVTYFVMPIWDICTRDADLAAGAGIGDGVDAAATGRIGAGDGCLDSKRHRTSGHSSRLAVSSF